MLSRKRAGYCLLLNLLFAACSAKPLPGPDKRGSGTLSGVAVGAGSGAILGAQVAAGAGPGAAVGAGFGAVFGALQGAGLDLLEDEDLKQMEQVEKLKAELWAQEFLADHYERRMRLHPGRDIYPADLFFQADSSKLTPKAKLLVREIAKRSKNSMSWSRILISSYMTANDEESVFAEKLNNKRAEEFALQFVKAGIEPRRISIRGVTLATPLLIDPEDSPARYRQAIEFLPLDY